MISSPAVAVPRRVLGRRLALGFGLVSSITALMYGLLLVLVGETSTHISSMRMDESAIRDSLVLATSIREQYMHQAHWLLERDDAHLDHRKSAESRIQQGAQELRSIIARDQIPRLNRIVKASEDMARMFVDELAPAVRMGEEATIKSTHHRIRQLSDRSSQDADALAGAIEKRMVRAHISATKTTNLALALGGFCVLLVVVLSFAFTLRLKQAVLKPLEQLSQAARRFGAGEFTSRAGEIGEGELLAVARAFDSMAEELQQRQRL